MSRFQMAPLRASTPSVMLFFPLCHSHGTALDGDHFMSLASRVRSRSPRCPTVGCSMSHILFSTSKMWDYSYVQHITQCILTDSLATSHVNTTFSFTLTVLWLQPGTFLIFIHRIYAEHTPALQL